LPLCSLFTVPTPCLKRHLRTCLPAPTTTQFTANRGTGCGLCQRSLSPVYRTQTKRVHAMCCAPARRSRVVGIPRRGRIARPAPPRARPETFRDTRGRAFTRRLRFRCFACVRAPTRPPALPTCPGGGSTDGTHTSHERSRGYRLQNRCSFLHGESSRLGRGDRPGSRSVLA
jgi:hypothetical protein